MWLVGLLLSFYKSVLKRDFYPGCGCNVAKKKLQYTSVFISLIMLITVQMKFSDISLNMLNGKSCNLNAVYAYKTVLQNTKVYMM